VARSTAQTPGLFQRKVDALGTRAAVAASHPSIALEGARVLADGGNAVDAALAAMASPTALVPAPKSSSSNRPIGPFQ